MTVRLFLRFFPPIFGWSFGVSPLSNTVGQIYRKVRENMKNINNLFMYEMAEDVTPENNPAKTDDNAGNKDNPADNPDNKPEEKEEPKPEDKPEDKPEEKTDNTAELTKEIETLKAELEKLKQAETDKATLEQKVTDLQNELDQLKTNDGTKDGMVKEYEEILNGMINAQLETIPENMRELVPANLNLKEKMAWLSKASELGLFKAQDKDVEIGKPLNPNNNNKQQIDTAKASPQTLLTMAYGNAPAKKK